MTNCLCTSGQEYAQCCEPYHTGKEPAPTAALLMRSRYCAYAMANADYLMKTTHRENQQYKKSANMWRGELLKYCRTMEFLGLDILEDVPGDTMSTVTFAARLSQNGKPFTMTEKSTFFKIGQRWLYHSGETM